MFGFLRSGRKAIPSGTTAAGMAISLPLDRLIDLRAEAVRTRSGASRGITQLPGLARTRLRGRGLDFDEMRPYAEGDDVRHIDWNVTARTGRPYTRLYREERERAVTVALDLRPSMFTGSRRLKAVVAGEYAAALLWRVAANRDRAGVLLFDGSETMVVRPAARQRGVLQALGAISQMFDKTGGGGIAAGGSGTLDAVIGDINRLSRNAGLIVLITDGHDPGPDFDHELAVAAQRQKLVVLRIADPLEFDGVPAGTYAYRAKGKAAVADLGSYGAAQVRTELAARNAALEQRFAAQGVSYTCVSSDTPCVDVWTLLAEQGIV